MAYPLWKPAVFRWNPGSFRLRKASLLHGAGARPRLVPQGRNSSVSAILRFGGTSRRRKSRLRRPLALRDRGSLYRTVYGTAGAVRFTGRSGILLAAAYERPAQSTLPAPSNMPGIQRVPAEITPMMSIPPEDTWEAGVWAMRLRCYSWRILFLRSCGSFRPAPATRTSRFHWMVPSFSPP